MTAFGNKVGTLSVSRGTVVIITAVAATVFGGLGGGAAVAATSKAASKPTLTASTSGVTKTSTYTATKSLTSQLAQTDPSLLKLTGTAPTRVIVKLAYDSLATYNGNLAGYAATSPSTTGKPLNVKSAASQHYLQHASAVQSTFTTALHSAVPSAKVGDSYSTLYGGVALTVPANQIAAVLSLPDVTAVQPDSLHKADAATTVNDGDDSFIGANAAYSALGSSATAGKGVIVADVDTGVWPEHPSFANRPDLSSPPPTADSHARACNFGPNPLIANSTTPFACNDKLIEGQVFLDTYNSVFPTGPNAELYATSARDSDGHGTHTSSTATGDPLTTADLFGINRGPIQGIAPGAWLMSYKALGPDGGFDSDLVGAIEQAVLDGAQVINYSVGPSTPTSAYTSADDLAFLDAYDAGVVVSTSAGNSGPGATTVAHNGPWELAAGATTLQRAFVSTATLSAPDASNLTVSGASIMPGISTSTPVVNASAAPYSDSVCGHAAPSGTFTGKIVVCVRGGVDSTGAALGRVQKGYNVVQGGAAGMFLINPVTEDVETDNHFLPAVHFDFPAGQQIENYLAAHTGVTATFTTGARGTEQGDEMAAFSSRGPGSDGFLKPDIAAPGVQILAGNTPTPTDVASGPTGQYFQAIAGTSMAAPHITGSAALVLALHPTFTPSQVMSTLMTTATTNVVKEDGTTPATPFDDGAGRVNLNNVIDPGLTLNVTPTQMDETVGDPAHRIDLNIPSVYDGALPGVVTTTRTFTNVDSAPQVYKVTATSTLAGGISVSPSTINVPPGHPTSINISLDGSNGTVGQTYFGQITLTQAGGSHVLHLPVAFTPAAPSGASISSNTTCTPSSIALGTQTSACTTTVQNNQLQPVQVTDNASTNTNLQILSYPGGTRTGGGVTFGPAMLHAATAPTPNVVSGSSPYGYIDLPSVTLTPLTPIGDEEIDNFNVAPFIYDGQTYSTIGVVSDGYVVVGGGDNNDVNFEPQTFPDSARPNNVLAPLWTDLDGTGCAACGYEVGTLSDGVNLWIVVQMNSNLYGTSDMENWQIWIGLNGVQDISYTYGDLVPIADQPFNVGAENADGSAGSNVPGMPSGDLVVQSVPGAPGGSVSYTTNVRGVIKGTGTFTSTVTAPQLRDAVVTHTSVHVT
jgi:subtilisin family serine protease